MKYTNLYGLPQAYENFILSHEHKSGFISASQMYKTVRQFWLIKRHYDEMTKDISEMIWMSLGTAVHSLFEKHESNGIAEKYLETEIHGITLSGKSDLYEDKKVTDYKTASVWKLVFKDYSDWEVQLNIYAYLFRLHKYSVNELNVWALLKDWTKQKVGSNDYPPIQMVKVPIKLWSFKEQDTKIKKKIEVLLKYKNIKDDNLPPCPVNKLWQGKDGKYRACGYCDGKPFCNQYIELKKQNLIKE